MQQKEKFFLTWYLDHDCLPHEPLINMFQEKPTPFKDEYKNGTIFESVQTYYE